MSEQTKTILWVLGAPLAMLAVAVSLAGFVVMLTSDKPSEDQIKNLRVAPAYINLDHENGTALVGFTWGRLYGCKIEYSLPKGTADE